MLDEGMINARLVQTLRKRLRGAVVLKHADRFRGGIPDIQVCLLGSSAWIETKLKRPKDQLKDLVDQKQLILGQQLATTCNGRSWFFVVEVDGSDEPLGVTIWQPRAMASQVAPVLTGYGAPVRPRTILDPLSVNLAAQVHTHHAIYVPIALAYDALAVRLIQDSIRA